MCVCVSVPSAIANASEGERERSEERIREGKEVVEESAIAAFIA